TVGPDGRGLRVIHFRSYPKSYSGGPVFASWSPTGRRLAYTRGVPGEQGATALFVSSARGTHERLLAAPSDPLLAAPFDPHSLFRARWSPDGSELAFIAGASLYAVRPDGSGLRTIVACPPPGTLMGCAVTGFDWSPDGSQ